MSGIRQAATIVSPLPPALRLLHYWWPLAMGLSLAIVVRRATGREWDPYGLALLLCGIAAAYSLDRVGDAWASRTPRLAWLLIAAGIGASALCAVLMWWLPATTRVIVPVLALCCALYPAMKKQPLLKTAVVSIAWTWSAIALPFHDGSWAGWQSALVPVAVPLTLLVAAGCVMCDLKDVDRDRRAGVAKPAGARGNRRRLRRRIRARDYQRRSRRASPSTCARHHRCLPGARLHPPALLSRDVIGPLMVDAILTRCPVC